MSRSGLVDEIDDQLAYGRYRAQVGSAIRGKRGQAFLRELAAAMDAMPDKVLIADELINEGGDCCTIGVICKARGVDVSKIDPDDPEQVAAAVDIARQMAAEIEYENDENDENDTRYERDPETGRYVAVVETPAMRWTRMRKWVDAQLNKTKG